MGGSGRPTLLQPVTGGLAGWRRRPDRPGTTTHQPIDVSAITPLAIVMAFDQALTGVLVNAARTR